jgi:hypothetical protein
MNQHATIRELLEAVLICRTEHATHRQQHHKHISAAMNQHATIKELLEAVVSVWSASRLYNEDQQQQPV